MGEVDVRKKHGINIMAIKHNGEIKVNITPQTVFQCDDTILVLGHIKSIQKCFHI